MFQTSIVLFLFAILTAVISTVTGMGGGILLFSFMTFFLTLDVIVPTHGIVQLSSNFSRVYYLKDNLLKKFVLPFMIGAALGVGIAVYLKSTLVFNPAYALFIVSLLILYTIFKPKKLPQIKVPAFLFFPIGIFCGFMGIFVGAVGPFLALFYVRDDFSKEEIIANKSFMQLWIHFLKLPAFISLGFDYIQYWPYWLPLIASSVIGTKIGVGLLRKIDEKLFRLIFKGALLIAATRLIIKSVGQF